VTTALNGSSSFPCNQTADRRDAEDEASAAQNGVAQYIVM
jgi:hypothetical protein